MAATSTDRIEKQVELRATLARVWQALTTAEEFGAWFRVKLDGAFAEGRTVRGHVTYPGYEHLQVEMKIERMASEQLFSYRWHPYPNDPGMDYSHEPMTLVEFRLQQKPGGTLLTVVESGFDQIPIVRRAEAFRMNSGGWEGQMDNIRLHVES